MSADSAIAVKTWHVRIDIGERDGTTHAIARLETGAGTDLRGVGETRLNPRDQDVPEIGDEVAAARALAHLAQTLLDVAAADVAQVLDPQARTGQ